MLCRLCMHAFAARQLAALRSQQQAGWKAAAGPLSSRQTSRTYATPSDSEAQTTGVLSRRLDVLAGRASRVQQVRVAAGGSATQGGRKPESSALLAHTGHRLPGQEGEAARHEQRTHDSRRKLNNNAATCRAQTWSTGRQQPTSGRSLPTRRKSCRRACRASHPSFDECACC